MSNSRRLRQKYANDKAPIKYQLPPPSQAAGLPHTFTTANDAVLLRFSNSFDQAPILGEHSDSNIIVRLANGLTLLQRLSPPCYQKALDLADGGQMKDALFDAASLKDLASHQVIECGLSYYASIYGWSAQHAQLADEADAMLHWIWRFFHQHVLPLASLLDLDLRGDLDRRRNPHEWFQKLLGPGQCSLTHPWWTAATVASGEGVFTGSELVDTQNHQPAILVGFEAPFVLLMAHEHGFFKTVVKPGQVVVFRPDVPHRICPMEKKQSATGIATDIIGSSNSRTQQAEGSKPRRSVKKSKAEGGIADKELWTILLTFPYDIFNETRPPGFALRQRLYPLPLQPDAEEQRRYAKFPRLAKTAKTPSY